uniref:hypothetical protein n=1 Tax=Endozoicomonas sp. YOMI1 TaxID=2828739 RepID=UPI0021474897
MASLPPRPGVLTASAYSFNQRGLPIQLSYKVIQRMKLIAYLNLATLSIFNFQFSIFNFQFSIFNFYPQFSAALA